jgi:multiple sugar transport system substrate-binding protein
MKTRLRGEGRAARIVLIALSLLLAAGCGPPKPKRTVIRFWGMGREGEVVQELVTEFEQENPDVSVKVQQIPWSAAHEKLLTSFVGRSTPDIAQLGNTWIAEFSLLEALEPLDRRVENSREVPKSAYFGGIWDTNVMDGVLYGIPWYVDTRLLFYRKDILAQAGYDSIPGTWAGWVEAMKAVKQVVGPDRFAILIPVNEWTVPVVLGLQSGSPLIKDDGTRGDFRSPEFRRSFAFFLDLFNEHLAPPVSNNEIANVYQEFGRGYFSMYVTGPWNVGEFKRRLPADQQDDWATSPLPGPEGRASGISLAGGSSLVVFKGSRHKDAAWKLVEFLSRPEQQIRFSRLTGDLPARREAWRDTSLSLDSRIAAFGDQLDRVVSTPKIPEWELIAARLQERAEAAVRGAAPPDSVLASLDRDVDRILAKRRWMLAQLARNEGDR